MPYAYDRILIRDRSYHFPSGVDRFRERMRAYFPGESAAIDGYVKAVNAAADASGLFFAEKAIPAALARLAGSFMRRRFLRWSVRNLYLTGADAAGALFGGVITASAILGRNLMAAVTRPSP